MNNMLVAAFGGFVFIELQAIATRSQGTNWSWSYYFRRNAAALLGNLVGTYLLYLASPDLIRIERLFIDRYLPVLSGETMPVLTGLATGLLGAWGLRNGVRWFRGTGSRLLLKVLPGFLRSK